MVVENKGSGKYVLKGRIDNSASLDLSGYAEGSIIKLQWSTSDGSWITSDIARGMVFKKTTLYEPTWGNLTRNKLLLFQFNVSDFDALIIHSFYKTSQSKDPIGSHYQDYPQQHIHYLPKTIGKDYQFAFATTDGSGIYMTSVVLNRGGKMKSASFGNNYIYTYKIEGVNF